MDLGLKGKVSIITGAGQGIGREIAKTLSREGAVVVVNDFFEERANAVAAEIKTLGGEAMAVKADVTDAEQVNEMVKKVVARFGTVDILVNNAGVPVARRTERAGSGPFIENTKRDWDLQINLNLYGNFYCTQAVLPYMIAKKKGKIVNIISDAGRVGESWLTAYSAAKAGVIGFTKALAKEMGRYSININCISVGFTIHEGQPEVGWDRDISTQQREEFKKQVMKQYPIASGLGRLGLPSDIANAVAFFASEVSPFITGQVLSVSGGYFMGS